MGLTSGLCGVNEFYDEVSGICGHCSDICREIAKPDSFCLYHCSDYYSRLLSTTAVAAQEEKPVTLLVTSSVLIVIAICAVILTCFLVLFCYLKRYKYRGRRNTEKEFTVSGYRRRRRVSRHSSVQETRDPNKQEDIQLSVLCISPCSSFVLAPDSATEGMRLKALVHDQPRLNRSGLGHQATMDATGSAQDILSSASEFEETQPKIACNIESGSLALNNKRSIDVAKFLSDDEETRISQTSKTLSWLHEKDTRKQSHTAEELRLGFRQSGLDSGENLRTPVQESYTLVSYRGRPS